MANRTPEGAIREQWERFGKSALGRRAFSLLLGRIVPYTGTLGAMVEEIRPGYARASIRDRRKLRNHLRSLHAIALMNLAELVTGLALNYGMRPDARSILKGLSIEYTKKARGTITGEATAPVLESNAEREIEVVGTLRDEAGEVVAVARAKWLVGPRK
ncbi:MAG TPA: DUF4442 domain-containing protein [Longimicrobium sp.]|nr:DUF4442 domain-containing protein [Longimicrobium sp.]